MEFLRFGSSIPGEYWGCCACCIIQNFKQHPDTPATIQLVSGDGGGACVRDRELIFAGPTLRDIFNTRIRIGTFGMENMPNHTFFAILEDSQLTMFDGEWLKILKAAGFEFIRTVDNSVYTGADLDGVGYARSPHPNHIFGLFRNIGNGRIKDPFTPPKAWSNLPSVVPEWGNVGHGGLAASADYDLKSDKEALKEFSDEVTAKQRYIWEAGETKFLKESEIPEGVPVIMAGLRTEFPPQLKEVREAKLKKRVDQGCPNKPGSGTQHLYKPKATAAPVLGAASQNIIAG